MEQVHIIYLGLNNIRPEEQWQGHGMKFEKNYVYHVTPEAWMFLKAIKGFRRIKGVVDGVVDLKKKVIKDEKRTIKRDDTKSHKKS